jgi:hypothetical protein
LKIILENTSQMVMVENREGDCRCAVPGRVWEGKTDTGIYVQCVITRIAAPADADQSQFERELSEQPPPVAGPHVFPLRMVL